MAVTGTPSIPDLMAQADALVRSGDASRAAPVYGEILRHNPNHADATHMLGVVALLQKDPGRAAMLITKAIGLNPLAGEYHTNLGNAFLALNRAGEAELAFRKALSLNPTNPEQCHARLAELLALTGREDEAVAEGRKALELAPKRRDLRFGLADLLFRTGRKRKDRALLDESRALYAGLAENGEVVAARSLGLCDLELARVDLRDGDRDRALDGCRRGLARLGEGSDGLTIVRDVAKTFEPEAAPAVREFSGCKVLTGNTEWFVIDRENRLYVDGLANGNPEVGPFVLLYERGGDTVLRPLPAARDLEAERAILLGGSRNYYHWLLDYFPRLGVLEGRDDLAALPLLCNGDLAKFQRECLKVAGIPERRLLKVTMPGVVSCPNLVVPDIGNQDTRFHPEALAWIRRTVGGRGKASKARRVYLARGKAAFRRVVNEKAVSLLLKNLGFVIAEPGRMAVVDQAMLVAGADVIVAAHGASLANMVFAEPGTRVIDLVPGKRFLPHFIASLSKALEFDYQPLRCGQRPTTEQARDGREQHYDMEVPLEALEAAVRTAEARTRG